MFLIIVKPNMLTRYSASAHVWTACINFRWRNGTGDWVISMKINYCKQRWMGGTLIKVLVASFSLIGCTASSFPAWGNDWMNLSTWLTWHWQGFFKTLDATLMQPIWFITEWRVDHPRLNITLIQTTVLITLNVLSLPHVALSHMKRRDAFSCR